MREEDVGVLSSASFTEFLLLATSTHRIRRQSVFTGRSYGKDRCRNRIDANMGRSKEKEQASNLVRNDTMIQTSAVSLSSRRWRFKRTSADVDQNDTVWFLITP